MVTTTRGPVDPRRPTTRVPEGQTFVREPRFERPLCPLSSSTWLPRHQAALGVVIRNLGLPIEGYDERVIDGRVYGRMVPMLDRGRDGKPPPTWLLRLLFRTVPAMRRRLSAASRFDGTEAIEEILDAWDSMGREQAASRARELRDCDLAAMSDKELADHLEAVLEHVGHMAQAHFELSFVGVLLASGRLGLFVQEHLGWSPFDILTLVQGYGSASTEHGRAVDRLATGLGPDGVCQAIEDPASMAGSAALQTYLDVHGHRVLADLSARTEAEDLGQVADHLRRWRGRPAAPGDPRADADQAAERARAALTSADRTIFDEVLGLARRGRPYGDETELTTLDAVTLVRYVALEAGRRWLLEGRLSEFDDIWFLTQPELSAGLRGAELDLSAIERRRAEHAWALEHPAPDVIGPPPAPPPPVDVVPARYRDTVGALLWSFAHGESGPAPEMGPAAAAELTGVGASPGLVRGTARVIRNESEFGRIEAGDIVVCPTTVAAWSPIFAGISGLVTEYGGLLSHPAILAREYGLPAVLSVPGATDLIPDGSTVDLDGRAGTVSMVSDQRPRSAPAAHSVGG